MIFLLVAFVLLYSGSKMHFFTSYGMLGTGEYLDKQRPFWAGMAVSGVVWASIGWRKEYRERTTSTVGLNNIS